MTPSQRRAFRQRCATFTCQSEMNKRKLREQKIALQEDEFYFPPPKRIHDDHDHDHDHDHVPDYDEEEIEDHNKYNNQGDNDNDHNDNNDYCDSLIDVLHSPVASKVELPLLDSPLLLDPVLDRTGLPIPPIKPPGGTSEKQHRGDNIFLFHTRFALEMQIPVPEPTIKKQKKEKFCSKPFHPGSCGLPVTPDLFHWYCVRCTGKNHWDLHLPPHCRICSTASIRSVRAVVTKKNAAYDFSNDASRFEDDSIDDDQEEAFNQIDERKVARDSTLTYEGRAVSLSKRTKELNDQWWSNLSDLDSTPLDPIQQSKRVLVMLPPRDLGQPTFRIALHKQNFLLPSASALQQGLQKIYYGVQRNMGCQLYAARRLDAIGHATLGPKGITALQHHTNSASCGLQIMNAETDWLYSEEHFEKRFRPVVVNTDNVKAVARNTTSCVTAPSLILPIRRVFLDAVMQGLGAHLEEVVSEGVSNKRGTVSISIGFTPVQAKRWEKLNHYDRAQPGFMEKMDHLSPPFLSWLGELGTILSYDLPSSVFANTSRALFNPPVKRRKYFQKLAHFLKLQDEQFLRAEAITIALGDLLDYHFDDLNDPRYGYDVVTVGSVVVDAACYLSPEKRQVLRQKSLNPSSLRITVISYTRRICGDKVQQDTFGYSSSCEAFQIIHQKLWEIGHGRADVLMDVERLCEVKFQEKLRAQLRHYPDSDYSTGTCVLLPEGISKLLYFSSTVHCIWKLAFKYKKRFTYKNLVEMLAFAAVECNGQSILYGLVTSWLSSPPVLFDGHQFQWWWDSLGSLYAVACYHCYLLKERKTKKRPPKKAKGEEQWLSSTSPRYQTSSALLYQHSDDANLRRARLESVNSLVQVFLGVFQSLREGTPTYTTIHKGYSKLKAIHSVGHLAAMTAIQLAGLFGVCAFQQANFGTVTKGGYGSYEFLNMNYSRKSRNDLTDTEVQAAFTSLYKDLNKAGHTGFQRREAENLMCILNRAEKKLDVVYFDKEDGFQNFFRPTKVGGVTRMQFLEGGEWCDFSDVVVPFFTVGALHEDLLVGWKRKQFPQHPFVSW
jgi:hypothetical protein